MSGFFSGRSGGGLTGGLPNGVKLAAIAFLIHQLMKQRGADAQVPGGMGQGGMGHGGVGQGGVGPGGMAPAGMNQGGGGLGEILGSLLGGAGGGGMLGGGAAGGGLGGLLGGGGLGGLLGGLAGMLGGMRGRGLTQVDSWISPGENQSVSTQDLEQHFDPHELDEAAQQAGTDRASLLEELRKVLPEFVDRMTPQGNLPEPGAAPQAGGSGDLGSVMDDILRGRTTRG